MIDLYRTVCDCCNGVCMWAIVVAHVRSAVNIIVSYHFGAGKVGAVTAWTIPVMIGIMIVHILGAYKYPPAARAVVVKSAAGTKGSPTAVAAAVTPAYPCRRPFVAGYPDPTIVGIIGPTAVVVGCPAPRFVGDPSVAIVGHHPVAITGVGAEVAISIGHPYVAVLWI